MRRKNQKPERKKIKRKKKSFKRRKEEKLKTKEIKLEIKKMNEDKDIIVNRNLQVTLLKLVITKFEGTKLD